jgi:rhodanese-related sulfurtransferase
MKKLEPFLYIVLFAVLCVGVLSEGARAAALERATGLAPKELYRRIAKRQGALQIVDVRGDVEENYEDTHIPGAIPFPGCDLEATPEGARDQLEPSVPTVVVSEDGDRAVFEKCAAFFASARNLEGGLEAWDDENLPEDSGEYQPPKPGAGGGCL